MIHPPLRSSSAPSMQKSRKPPPLLVISFRFNSSSPARWLDGVKRKRENVNNRQATRETRHEFNGAVPSLVGRGFFSWVSACFSLAVSNDSMPWRSCCCPFSWAMTAKRKIFDNITPQFNSLLNFFRKIVRPKLPSGSGRTIFSWVSVGFRAALSKDSTPCSKFCCVFSWWTTKEKRITCQRMPNNGPITN